MQQSQSVPPPDLESAGAFAAAVGLRFAEITGQRVTGVVDLGPEHHTPWGVVHGGVYATIVESAASVGASAAVADRGQFAVGLHNGTDFLRSTHTATASVEAIAVIQGRTQQLWDMTITGGDGKLLARGSLRLQNVDRKA
ncbi:MAG TPA: PaaI family thioesterase [Nocardioides sp.]|nr:PaaI family thioesterase [Nocardioides sp.]